jgi:hypothetical protein
MSTSRGNVILIFLIPGTSVLFGTLLAVIVKSTLPLPPAESKLGTGNFTDMTGYKWSKASQDITIELGADWAVATGEHTLKAKFTGVKNPKHQKDADKITIALLGANDSWIQTDKVEWDEITAATSTATIHYDNLDVRQRKTAGDITIAGKTKTITIQLVQKNELPANGLVKVQFPGFHRDDLKKLKVVHSPHCAGVPKNYFDVVKHERHETLVFHLPSCAPIKDQIMIKLKGDDVAPHLYGQQNFIIETFMPDGKTKIDRSGPVSKTFSATNCGEWQRKTENTCKQYSTKRGDNVTCGTQTRGSLNKSICQGLLKRA